jgi:ribosome-associated protein
MEDKSKSERKREMTGLQKLGERLAELSHEQAEKIGVPKELQEALILAGTLKSHSALRRQKQYIGVLMRRFDTEHLKQAIDDMDRGQKSTVREFHQLELLRDSLVDGDDTAFDEIVRRFPEVDKQQLRKFVQSAQKEKKENKPPKQSRVLFKYLRGLSAKS